MNCLLCALAKTQSVFETEQVVVIVAPKPACMGHLIVLPKQHYPILEQVPENVVAELFDVANKLSMVLFQGLKAQGTNVLIQNGLPAGQADPHVSLHVLPRFPNDGIDFTWKPLSVNDEQLDLTEKTLKGATDMVGVVEQPKAKPREEEKVPEQEATEEDLELKHLNRIP